MSFFEVSLKMFRKDFARHRLYFLCCLFAATVFFCFASMFTNPSLMEGQAVDSMISSNIIFPSVLSAVFLLMVVPYSYTVFLSSRQREYGVLFCLGMSRGTAWKRLLGEAMALGVLALAASLALGTFLSMVFYGIVSNVIGLTSLQWVVPCQAYIVTTLLYVAALGLTVAFLVVRLMGRRIRLLLLAPYQAERKGRAYSWMKKHFPGYARKHVLEFSLLARHKQGWAARYCLSALLVGSVCFLVSFCVVFQSSVLRDVENYCPYDLAYSEIFGKNKISGDELLEVLSGHNVLVTEEKQIPFVRDNAFNYFPVSEINEKLGSHYKVSAGKFLSLFQFEVEDGYGYEMLETPRVHLKLGMGNLRQAKGKQALLELQSCGSDIRVLFNKSPGLADYNLILNDADFELIKSNGNYWFGKMHLFRLQNWQESSAGISALQSLLKEANGLNQEEQWDFCADSKIEQFQVASQSGRFNVFLMSFLEALMLMAAYLLIHFGIMAEQEENRRLQKSLFMVGVTAAEEYRLFLFKDRMRFLPPLLISLLFSQPFLYKMGEGAYHSGKVGCFAGALAGVALLLAAIKYTAHSSKRELALLKRGQYHWGGRP